MHSASTAAASHLPCLQGVRIVSLALNLPGPAALLRCTQMGAHCTKLEPPPTTGYASADPMGVYSPVAYAALHHGVNVLHAHLKTDEGQATLHTQLAQTDVLLTSFRPSALHKLGLGWESLHARYPQLSLIRIVGALGARAEEPGHDLTYQAEAGLLTDLHMPPTLFADMAGALVATEAVLQVLLAQRQYAVGQCIEVGLAEAAQWLALPLQWGLTTAQGDVGGAHAGYRIYPCADGRVAVAALEPHFAARLCRAAGLMQDTPERASDIADTSVSHMRSTAMHEGIARFLHNQSCAQLTAWAQSHDIPLHIIS